MEALKSASLGAMGSLLRKLDELMHTEDRVPNIIRQLREDVSGISTKLVELSEVHDPPLTVNYWMKEARELSYDIEDCVDQFVHAASDDKMAWIDEISGLMTRVEDVVQRYHRFKLGDVHSHPAVTNTTTSYHVRMAFKDANHIAPVGIEGPKNEILSLLKPKTGDDENELQLKVVSILGVEGIGKSTLAQELWHVLMEDFECHALVLASKKPDMRMILRNILLQVRPDLQPEAHQVSHLIHSISMHLQDKRYFIIIDDLWTVSVWDTISRAFPEGNCCSRIITTTTIEDVALACCSYDPGHIIKMKSLSCDHSKELFMRTVFGSEQGCPRQLHAVSDEISRKCGGLPLAITCIATLLARQPETVDRWDYISNFLNHNLRSNPTSVEILKQVLNLCYIILPHCLKTCLLYLSVYPENYIILKDDLVKQWIAEDFVCAREEQDTVEVASSYFDELVSLCLIQRTDINSIKKGRSYIVHPMVFDFIRCKSVEDNFISVIDYSQSTVVLTDKIRRLSLHFGSATYATTPASIGLSQVRSLSFMGLSGCMPSLVQFKLVRVMILHLQSEDGDTILPLREISGLFLLRYLQVRCSFTVELPEQLGCLKHLATLKINARVAAVPSDIVHHPSLLQVRLGAKTKHKHLGPVTSGRAMFPDDLSSLPTPAVQVLELLPPICSFSRLPAWFQRLHALRVLEVVVRELQEHDVLHLGQLPVLADLSLYVRKPRVSVTFCGQAFPLLMYFKLVSGAFFLTFLEEALPNLRRMKIGFNVHRREIGGNMLVGVHHLLNLREVAASIGVVGGADDADRIAAESTLQAAIGKHPGCPSFKVTRVDPIDEEYDLPHPERQDRSHETESSNKGDKVLKTLGLQSIVLWWQRTRYGHQIFIDVPGQNDHRLDFGQIKRFTWRELQIATNNFSEQNVLGKGSFGKVYKGVLPGPDRIKIAVKRLLNMESPEGELDFLKEVELISIAVHKNILRLIGFCTTPTERLLVYPFMKNLSVASRLRDVKLNEPALDWSTRMRIALDAAHGLEYLHEHCNPKIIHRDVKAANVLLDGNFEAVVGDFGLVKMVNLGRNTVATGLRGTTGHIAPEYLKTGRPSVKADVFGFGVTLLEIVTGERAIGIYPDRVEEAGEIMLIDQVKILMEEGRLHDIVDRNLGGAYNLEELEKVTQIALLCTQMDPDQRPAMSEVVQMLEGEFVPEKRWEAWQLAELNRRQLHEMRQQRKLFSFNEESLNIQEAIKLSTGRYAARSSKN